MATAEQIKSLIRSHFGGNPERFYSIALQVAAHEAKQGHKALAHDIRDIVDKDRKAKGAVVLRFPKDMLGLVISEEPEIAKSALVIPSALETRIERIIHEYRQQHKLKSHGLTHRRKVLLIGLVTKFMGETSAKLRQIFDLIQNEVGVYFFDEFDAIGGERSIENDVGEMRRVLNSFLQFIEQDSSDSMIVAATNSPKLLDRALFRRFDDVMYYEQPSDEERKRLIKNVLGPYLASRFTWKQVIAESCDLSHAEIDQACRDAIKNAILSERAKVSTTELICVH